MVSESEYEAAKDALANFEKDIVNILSLLPRDIDGERFSLSDMDIMRAIVREAIEEAAFEKTKSFEGQIREYELVRKYA